MAFLKLGQDLCYLPRRGKFDYHWQQDYLLTCYVCSTHSLRIECWHTHKVSLAKLHGKQHLFYSDLKVVYLPLGPLPAKSS